VSRDEEVTAVGRVIKLGKIRTEGKSRSKPKGSCQRRVDVLVGAVEWEELVGPSLEGVIPEAAEGGQKGPASSRCGRGETQVHDVEAIAAAVKCSGKEVEGRSNPGQRGEVRALTKQHGRDAANAICLAHVNQVWNVKSTGTCRHVVPSAGEVVTDQS